MSVKMTSNKNMREFLCGIQMQLISNGFKISLFAEKYKNVPKFCLEIHTINVNCKF